jgi:hypothetical protein
MPIETFSWKEQLKSIYNDLESGHIGVAEAIERVEDELLLEMPEHEAELVLDKLKNMEDECLIETDANSEEAAALINSWRAEFLGETQDDNWNVFSATCDFYDE